MRKNCLLAALVLLVAAAVLSTGGAQAAAPKGDVVRKAWPEKQAHKPPTGLTRWLARQVGPTAPVACPLRPAKVRSSCSSGDSSKVSGDALSGVGASRLAPFGGDGPAPPPAAAARASTAAAAATKPLALIRSFEIPVGDPSYERLLNLSYTYDSALAATAFVTEGLGEQAGRLLDQLAALQFPDAAHSPPSLAQICAAHIKRRSESSTLP